MVIIWIPLLIGLFFGLIPPRSLMKSEVRYLDFEYLWTKAIRPPVDERWRRSWWKLPLVWIDPVRGYVVAMFIMEAFPRVASGSGLSPYPRLITFTILLLFSLWIQTTGRKRAGETISPTGFLAGMLLALLPPEISVPVLIIGGATIIAVREYVYGYIAAFLFFVGLGAAVRGTGLGAILFLITPGCLILLPLVVNWLRGTRLVVPVRC